MNKFAFEKEKNYRIIESSNKIDFELENEKKDLWFKPAIQLGTLILIDEDIEFSK